MIKAAFLQVTLILCCLTNNVSAEKPLLAQTEIVHLARESSEGEKLTRTIRAEPKQSVATPVRISGWVKSRGVPGVPGNGFGLVTNLEYAQTPVYWDTLIFPETGTQPWHYVERLVHARLPIQAVEMKFMLDRRGEVWFRDFKVEAIEPWEENADIVVAMLGDSTDMASYLPMRLGVAYQLESLLRDRFPDRLVQVRNLAQSGDWLGQLLASGRLEWELNTLPRCDLMVIRYGLNDNSKAEPEQFKRQLGEVCDRVIKRFPGAQVVLATTLPPRGNTFEAVTRALATDRKLPLVDVAARFRSLAAAGVWNWHLGPGTSIGYDTHGDAEGQAKALHGSIHPNAFGCRVIAETIYFKVEPLAASRLATKNK